MTAETFDPDSLGPVTVTLSPEAERHIGQQLEQTGRRHLRLGVEESGCNGYRYTLDYIDQPEAGERACYQGTALPWQLFVRSKDLAFVRGTEIILEVNGLNRALKFRNPNADSHCGCGESFSVAS